MSTSDRIHDQGLTEREVLEQEIEATREELGATVEALAHKADVKAQVHEKVEETKAQVQEKVEETRAHLLETKISIRNKLDTPAIPAAAAAVTGALLLISFLRARRR
jgi:ribosome-binding protein aMBF1 (putative translation factor)